MRWLCGLLSKSDASADSVIVGGLFALLWMSGLVAFQVVARDAVFDPTSYAMAAGGIIGAVAAGKRLRDGVAGNGSTTNG